MGEAVEAIRRRRLTWQRSISVSTSAQARSRRASGPKAAGSCSDHLGQLVDELAVARHVAELARLALVADDGHGEPPALTGLADHVGGVDAGAVEEDLAELTW